MTTSHPMLFIATLLAISIGSASAWPLVYHGGPVLKSFTIVPYYYGPWKAAKITEHQNYLVGLAQYISGANAKSTQRTMLVQYGTTSAGVAPPVIKNVSLPIKLDTPGALAVIHAAQTSGKLPQYAADNVILLLLPTGAVLTYHCAYHGAEAVGKYYAFVQQDCSPWLLVTAHEIFEAATSPAIGVKTGWDESVDDCSTSFPLWFGTTVGVYDNSISACSPTGYDTIAAPTAPGSFSAVWKPVSTLKPEIIVTGWTYANYRAKYDELWPRGWRLRDLQVYVSGSSVLYNAIWQPGTYGEIQVYGWSQSALITQYNTLWPQGWRLAFIQPYVVGTTVYYTAVWTQSTSSEIQVYGWSYADYRAKYDSLWASNWRLKFLKPYVVSGTIYYTAVWRPGSYSEFQVYSFSYTDYRAKYDAIWASGWRLRILQPFWVSGKLLYTAVWTVDGGGEIQVYSWSAKDFRAKNDAMRASKYQLAIVQGF